jgi:hypothetical protein
MKGRSTTGAAAFDTDDVRDLGVTFFGHTAR